MPAVMYSNQSLAEFFEKNGMTNPANNKDQWDNIYTVEYDPKIKEQRFMSLAEVYEIYQKTAEKKGIGKLMPVLSNGNYEGHPERMKENPERLNKNDLSPGVNTGRDSYYAVIYSLTDRIQKGNLYVYSSKDHTTQPKAIKGPPIAADPNDNFNVTIRRAEFAFEENKAFHVSREKLEKPKMSVGKYLASIFGGYKEERAEYDKKLKEYKANKALVNDKRNQALIKGVAQLAAEREKQLEIEKNDPYLAKRKELLKAAEEMREKYEKQKETITAEAGDDVADDIFRSAKYLRRTSPGYQETYQELKNGEIVRAVPEEELAAETKPITADTISAPASGIGAYLGLTQGSNKSPKEAKAEYQKYYSAMENLHFNTKPDNRKQDIEFLTNLCKESVDTSIQMNAALGYNREHEASRNINSLSSFDTVGPTTSLWAMGQFAADYHYRVLITKEILNQIELKGNSSVDFHKEKANCDIIAHTCEKLERYTNKYTRRNGDQGEFRELPGINEDYVKANIDKTQENRTFTNKILSCQTEAGMITAAALQIANGMERPQGVSAETVAQAMMQTEKGKECLSALATQITELKSGHEKDSKDAELDNKVKEMMQKTAIKLSSAEKEKAPAEQTKEKAEPVATVAKEKSEPTSEKQADGKQADQKQKQTAKSKAM